MLDILQVEALFELLKGIIKDSDSVPLADEVGGYKMCLAGGIMNIAAQWWGLM
jgi:hypothetical protein